METVCRLAPSSRVLSKNSITANTVEKYAPIYVISSFTRVR